jgi:hypothetical protein
MSTSRRVKIDPGASRPGRPYHHRMFRGGTLVLSLLLGCSPSGGEIGAPSGSDSGGEPGSGGESGAPSEPTSGTGGTGGTGGDPVGGAGGAIAGSGGTAGVGSAGQAGLGGAGTGGTEPTEPELGSGCTIGGDECAGMDIQFRGTPICVPTDGMAGGELGRPGHCTWSCGGFTSNPEVVACTDQGGSCMPVGTLISHCVAW